MVRTTLAPVTRPPSFACRDGCSAACRRARRPRIGKDLSIDLLLVKPDGTAWLLNEAFDFEPVENEFIAIGSGAAYAMGAMACGRTAVQSLKVAARFDVSTSAPIDIVQLAGQASSAEPNKR
jgi:ATP-dependent protease HslVU (ClpYQ) peptidase subunit